MAIIVVKIVKPNAKAITTAACNVTNCEAATNWTQQVGILPATDSGNSVRWGI